MKNKKKAVSIVQAVIILAIIIVAIAAATPVVTRKIALFGNGITTANATGWYESYYALPEGAKYYSPDCKAGLSEKDVATYLATRIKECDVKIVSKIEAGNPALNSLAVDADSENSPYKAFQRYCQPSGSDSADNCDTPQLCPDGKCKFKTPEGKKGVNTYSVYIIGSGGASGSAIKSKNAPIDAYGKTGKDKTIFGTGSTSEVVGTVHMPEGSFLDIAKTDTTKINVGSGSTIEKEVIKKHTANNTDSNRNNISTGSAANVIYLANEFINGVNQEYTVGQITPTRDYTGWQFGKNAPASSYKTALMTPLKKQNELQRGAKELGDSFINRYYRYSMNVAYDCTNSTIADMPEWVNIYSCPINKPCDIDPEYCKAHPTDIDKCYCPMFPDDLRCVCRKNPNDARCLPEHCAANPNDLPTCCYLDQNKNKAQCIPTIPNPIGVDTIVKVKSCSGNGGNGGNLQLKNHSEACVEHFSGEHFKGRCQTNPKELFLGDEPTCECKEESQNAAGRPVCISWKCVAKYQTKCNFTKTPTNFENYDCPSDNYPIEEFSCTNSSKDEAKKCAKNKRSETIHSKEYAYRCFTDKAFKTQPPHNAAARAKALKDRDDFRNDLIDSVTGVNHDKFSETDASKMKSATLWHKDDVNADGPDGTQSTYYTLENAKYVTATRNDRDDYVPAPETFIKGGKGSNGYCVQRYKKVTKIDPTNPVTIYNGKNNGVGKKGKNGENIIVTDKNMCMVGGGNEDTANNRYEIGITYILNASRTKYATKDDIDVRTAKNQGLDGDIDRDRSNLPDVKTGYAEHGKNGDDVIARINTKTCYAQGGRGGIAGFINECMMCPDSNGYQKQTGVPGANGEEASKACETNDEGEGWKITKTDNTLVAKDYKGITEAEISANGTSATEPGLYNYRYVWYMPYVTKHLMLGTSGEVGEYLVKSIELNSDADEGFVIIPGSPVKKTDYTSGSDGLGGNETKLIKTSGKEYTAPGGKGGIGTQKTLEYVLCHAADKNIFPCNLAPKTTENLQKVQPNMITGVTKSGKTLKLDSIMSHSLAVAQPGSGAAGYNTKSANDYVCEERRVEQWDKVNGIDEMKNANVNNLKASGTEADCRNNARIEYIKPDGIQYAPKTGAVIILWN